MIAYIVFNWILLNQKNTTSGLKCPKFEKNDILGDFEHFSKTSNSIPVIRNFFNRPYIFRISSYHLFRNLFHTGSWNFENSWKLTRPNIVYLYMYVFFYWIVYKSRCLLVKCLLRLFRCGRTGPVRMLGFNGSSTQTKNASTLVHLNMAGDTLS